jgi:hypothetical protein
MSLILPALLLLKVVEFRFRMLPFRGACGELCKRIKIQIQGSMCAPASASKCCKNGLPRRMPCEKNSQVVGTLLFQESHILHSNQLVNEGKTKITQQE